MGENMASQEVIDGNQLKRDILASTYVSQARVRANQSELDRQTAKLAASAQQADQLQGQTRQAASIARRLVDEARSRNRCRRLCRCLCCLGCFQPSDDEPATAPLSLNTDGPLNTPDNVNQATASPRAESLSGHEGELVLRQVDNLLESKQSNSGAHRDQAASWKRRLAPAPGTPAISSTGRATLWFRQVDAGLSELQQTAKEMGQTLDEQVRLAQMLSVYLVHGIEDIGTAREQLAKGRLFA